MTPFKVHIIHVGNMDNKGTQALISSDVSVISEIGADISISISTSDVAGVKRLKLPVDSVLPPMVDIPLRRADQFFKNLGFGRGGLFYQVFTLAMLLLMPVQISLSLFSVILDKVGLRAIYRSAVIEKMKNCDLVISHSDENFKETASLLPLNPYWALTWWSILVSRTLDVVVAKSLGRPVVMLPNSVGPFRTWVGRFLARLALNSCDYILIREPVSCAIVDELGIDTVKILTYDTALLFNRVSKPFKCDFDKPVVGVSPGVYSNSLSKREVENFVESHAKALDSAVEKHGFDVVFLPHYISGLSNDDLDISKAILGKMRHKHRAKILRTDRVSEFKFLLNQMDLVITSKMHPAILAVTGYVPVLCIAYDHKQTAFFERLNMAGCLLNIRTVSYENLSSKIDQTWIAREWLRNSLKQQIPQWQDRVRSVIKKVVTPYVKSTS